MPFNRKSCSMLLMKIEHGELTANETHYLLLSTSRLATASAQSVAASEECGETNESWASSCSSIVVISLPKTTLDAGPAHTVRGRSAPEGLLPTGAKWYP